MANRIKGITIEINGNTTPLSNALKDVNKTISKTQSELRDVDKLLKLDPKNTDLLKQKQTLLADAIKATGAKLDEEKKALEQLKKSGNTEETQAQQRALEREIIATEQSLEKLASESIKTDNALKGVGDEAEDAGEKAEKGKKGWSALKQIVADLATSAVKMAVQGLKKLGKASVDAVKDAVKAGDEIDKMSQKLGLSRQGYQEWDFVLSQAGVDINSLQTGMKTMTNQIGKAKGGTAASVDAFNKLGISLDDLNKMSREESFGAIVKSLQGMEDSTERAALANKLFGKSGQNLTPLLNTSAEATDEMIKKASELGMVMSDDAVNASVEFQDQLAGLQHTFEATKNGIMSQLLPGITEAMAGFQELIVGADGGAEKLKSGIENTIKSIGPIFARIKEIASPILTALIAMLPTIFKGLTSAITSLFPDLIKAVLDILPSLLDAVVSMTANLANLIVNMLPTLVEAISKVVTTLLPNLAAMLPKIIQAIIKVVPLLVNSLIKAIPELLNGAIQFLTAIIDAVPHIMTMLNVAIPQIVTTITAFLTNPKTIEMVIVAAVKLLSAIIKAIPQVISSLRAVLPSIIEAIKKGLRAGLSTVGEAAKALGDKIQEKLAALKDKARTWAKDMINNFVQGIRDNLGKIANAAKDIGKKIKEFIGFSEPEKGPLSNFHTFAPDMVDLFVKGIKDNMPKLQLAVDEMAQTIGGGTTTNNKNVTVNQYNSYSNPHSNYEIWKSGRDLKRTITNTVVGAV